MTTGIKQVMAGAGVAGVLAVVMASAPVTNPLACVGLALVAVGVFTEARRRTMARSG